MRRRQASDPDAAFYFMSMVASTKWAMSRTRLSFDYPMPREIDPVAFRKRVPRFDGTIHRTVAQGRLAGPRPPDVAVDFAIIKGGQERGGCQILFGSIRGILCGFPSGRISGEIVRISNPLRGIEPAVATNDCYKCWRPVTVKHLKS